MHETLESARKEAGEFLLKTVKPFLSLGENIENMRKELTSLRKTVSLRAYRYFRRELSRSLLHSRQLHYTVQIYRKKEIFSCMPTLALLENKNTLNTVIFKKEVLDTPEQKNIQEMLDGTHFSKIYNPTLSSRVIACAVELYPLDTIYWIAQNKPQWLNGKFISRLAVKTALGLNPEDVEQFNIFSIAKNIPAESRVPFRKLVMTIARKNNYNFLKRYTKYLNEPLSNPEKEMRRAKNIRKYLFYD